MIGIMLLILSTTTLSAQSDSSAVNQLADVFLGKWVGEGENPDGDKFVSTLNFKWALGKHFVEVENQVTANGKPQDFARTFYGWQPVLQQLVFWSFDRNGTINEGVAELEGATLKHEWRSFTSGGEITDWRSSLTKNGDRLTFALFDDRGQETFSIEYKKTK